MAYSLGDIVVRLKADTSNLERGLGSAEASTGRFNKAVGGIGKALKIAGIALAVGGAAAVAFGIKSVKAYNESERELTQLNAVLKSTKGAAGVTSDAAIKLSKSIQKVTSFSDEDALAVENMGLTFTAIHKDIFPAFTKAALDTATALNHGMKPSMEQTVDVTKMLGKAMQDPDAGLGALHRYGVNVEDLKKKFTANMSVAEKQKLIIQELGTEFGGSAAAQAKTFSGRIDQLKNSFNDVQESIGKAIADAIIPFISKAATFIASVDWTDVINRSTASIKHLWGEIMTLYDRIEKFLAPSFDALYNTLNQKVLPTLNRLWKEIIEPLIPVVGTVLVVAIKLAVDALNAFLRIITPVINFMISNKWVVLAMASAFTALRLSMAFGSIKASFIANMNAIIAKIASTKGTLMGLKAAATTPFGMTILVAGALASLYAVYNLIVAIKRAARDVNNAYNSAVSAGNAQSALIRQLQGIASGKIKAAISPAQAKAELHKLAGRATGGPVNMGQAYIVGEQGPEVFVPRQSGVIVPNNKMGGGVSIHGDINIDSKQDADYLLNRLNRNSFLEQAGVSPV